MLAVSPGIRREIRATLAIAAPLAAANLAQMAMGFTDTVMVGHLGGAALPKVQLTLSRPHIATDPTPLGKGRRRNVAVVRRVP